MQVIYELSHLHSSIDKHNMAFHSQAEQSAGQKMIFQERITFV